MGSQLLHYVQGLGPVAKSVLIILLLLSVLTWAVILFKFVQLYLLNRKDLKLAAELRSLKDIDKIRKHLLALSIPDGTFLGEALKGLLSETEGSPLDIAFSNLSVARERYESFLVLLAIAGSASPFIGLFGTVWGIMDAFKGIGQAGGASLSIVSQGIADALVATACGLFVAIPAVVFYNLFQHFVKKWERRAVSISTEFASKLGIE